MGSQWALEQAKYNLVNEYMLVGVTEELEDFVMMLEAALPRFFKGATDLYKTGALAAKWLRAYVIVPPTNIIHIEKPDTAHTAKHVCI